MITQSMQIIDTSHIESKQYAIPTAADEPPMEGDQGGHPGGVSVLTCVGRGRCTRSFGAAARQAKGVGHACAGKRARAHVAGVGKGP